jgi:hypothetical protein
MANIVLNPGFEDVTSGSFANWSNDTPYATPEETEVHGGEYSCKLEGNEGGYAFTNQFVEQITSGSGTLSVWALGVDKGEENYPQGQIQLYGRKGGDWIGEILAIPITTGSVWTEFSDTFEYDSELYDNFRIEIVGEGTEGAIIYVDDVSVDFTAGSSPTEIEGTLDLELDYITMYAEGEVEPFAEVEGTLDQTLEDFVLEGEGEVFDLTAELSATLDAFVLSATAESVRI